MKKLELKNTLIFIYLITILLLASCGKGEVKQVSQESKIAQEAFGLAETLEMPI